MKDILHWLTANRKTNIAIVVFLSVLYPIIHDKASEPFYWMVKQWGHVKFHLFLNIFFVAVFAYVLFLFRYYIKNHNEKANVLGYGAMTIAGVLICYFMLMPYRSEGMHFIQYGLLGFLIFPLSPSLFWAIMLSAFVGYLDEYYQYFVTKKFYLDFNDLMLNLFASGLGVCIAYLVNGEGISVKRKCTWKNILKTPYLGIVVLAVIIVAGLMTGIFTKFNDQDGLYPLARHTTDNFNTQFWYTENFKTSWHRIRTYPGLLLMSLLPLIYLRIDKAEQNEI